MSNGNQHNRRRQRSGKRYKVRYDRLLAAVLVLIVLIVLLTSCVKSCSKSKKSSDSSDDTSTTASETAQSSIVDNLDTSSKQGDTLMSSSIDSLRPSASQFVAEPHANSDVKRGNLILVNANNEYTFPADDIELKTLYDNRTNEYYSVSDYVIKLDKECLSSLDAWMLGFYQAQKSTEITVIGGYRTLEVQNDKYSQGYSGFKGGCSDYHTGRTFDMGIFPKDGSSSGFYMPTGIYSWLDENSAEYGFIVRFPDDKESITGEKARTQTYRYVGKPHATYIKQNDLCLEEYIELLKSYTNTEPLEITVGQNLYQVYYVKASETGNTDVPVPQNKVYTVSGNNVDGFIVTVSLN